MAATRLADPEMAYEPRRPPLPDPGDAVAALRGALRPAILGRQATAEGFPVLWIAPEARSRSTSSCATRSIARPLRAARRSLGIDETERQHGATASPPRASPLAAIWSASAARPTSGSRSPATRHAPAMPTLAGIYPAADWYEREAFDMFGLRFDGRASARAAS
jgi:NADH-quinone oxidoreductase subunit C/D